MSTKCPRCGLTNFSDAVVCKKCNARLASGKPSKDSYQPGRARSAKADSATKTTDEPAQTRKLGLILAALGGTLGLAGLILLIMSGASPYFLVAGIGIAASGALIAKGKRLGIFSYVATFGIMLIWSLIQGAGDLAITITLILAALIGAYLLKKVRPQLR
jgi:hypothetical protein